MKVGWNEFSLSTFLVNNNILKLRNSTNNISTYIDGYKHDLGFDNILIFN